MPRICLACASPEREAIEKALVSGEPLRNIAKRVSISAAALLRHKNHVAQVIVNRARGPYFKNPYREVRKSLGSSGLLHQRRAHVYRMAGILQVSVRNSFR